MLIACFFGEVDQMIKTDSALRLTHIHWLIFSRSSENETGRNDRVGRSILPKHSTNWPFESEFVELTTVAILSAHHEVRAELSQDLDMLGRVPWSRGRGRRGVDWHLLGWGHRHRSTRFERNWLRWRLRVLKLAFSLSIELTCISILTFYLAFGLSEGRSWGRRGRVIMFKWTVRPFFAIFSKFTLFWYRNWY